jgi:hypothetical protein
MEARGEALGARVRQDRFLEPLVCTADREDELLVRASQLVEELIALRPSPVCVGARAERLIVKSDQVFSPCDLEVARTGDRLASSGGRLASSGGRLACTGG